MMPPGTSVWVLGSGKVGHEVHCLGLAEALGLDPIIKPVRPRRFFAVLAPWGLGDPREAPQHKESPLAPPFPDIVIGAGRSTIPYLRRLKRASGGRVFTIFMQDPRIGASAADFIWVPEHDKLRGPNVFVTLTSPHGLRPEILAAARLNPDPRIAALTSPRVAMVLGGPSSHHRFEQRDIDALAHIARDLISSGNSVMVTPSRRTPQALTSAISQALSASGASSTNAFVWQGEGANPYANMLANADAIIVTADSTNMMGEAVATGAPVHIYEPTGGHRKLTSFLERLIAEGLVRRWQGALESWKYTPVDATTAIAGEVARRYHAFHNARP